MCVYYCQMSAHLAEFQNLVKDVVMRACDTTMLEAGYPVDDHSLPSSGMDIQYLLYGHVRKHHINNTILKVGISQ